jgi:hypothetical protein
VTGGNSATTSGGFGGSAASDVAGAGGSDATNTCNLDVLWTAIDSGSVGRVQCTIQDPPYTGEAVNPLDGAVVFDHEGRVIDNTGLTGEDKQYWLDDLANERWLCLADQTIGYKCKPVSD